jgi:iron complex transport system ATP-binding protein
MSGIVVDIKGLVSGYRNGSASGYRYPTFNAVALGGELIALVGRNGVGKSTLLRTLARLQPALSGKIFVKGVETHQIPIAEFAQLVSFIPSEPAHASHTTVYEFVSMARYPYHGWFEALNEDDHRIVQAAIDAVGMQSFYHRFIDNLSDGERQRVMIAFAIAQDTPIIMMDEPTAFLDLPNKFEVMRLLREQAQMGKTIIISTHDLQTAFGLVDTIWLMLPDGIRVGAPEDIVLSGNLNRLMDDTPVFFDLKSGQFVYKHQTKRLACILGGSANIKKWTSHALRRMGYEVEFAHLADASVYIQVQEHEGKVQWILGRSERNPTFDSIRNLCIYLKSIEL